MFYDFITKHTELFVEKERSFCNAKASHIFSTKNIGITSENLTKRFEQTTPALINAPPSSFSKIILYNLYEFLFVSLNDDVIE